MLEADVMGIGMYISGMHLLKQIPTYEKCRFNNDFSVNFLFYIHIYVLSLHSNDYYSIIMIITETGR